MMEHFLDPGYRGHAAAARLTGLLALRLANADVPPLRYSAYAAEVKKELRSLQDEQAASPLVDLGPAFRQAAAWRAATLRLEERVARLLRSGKARTKGARAQFKRLAAVLRGQERALIQERGLPGRPWFKHQVYAPGRLTGYAAQPLPALAEAIEDGDAAVAVEYRELLVDSLARATREAEDGAGAAAR